MSNNKDFKVKNGVVANGYLETVGSVTTVAGAGGPLFSGMAYSGVSLSVSSENNTPRDIAFNNDGTKMYICGFTGDVIYQYSLTTGFDLSTASYDSVSLDTTSTTPSAFSVDFNTTGSKMFVLRYNGPASVHQYSLSTSFDLSTASYDNVSFSVAAENYVAYDFTFNNDGTKMYMVGHTGTFVYQYTLSTGFSISTASYDNVSFSISSQDTVASAIAFNSDGSKVYIAGDTTNSVYEYILTTPFDLSTQSYTGINFSFANQDTNPSGIVFNNDGSKMFMTGFSSDSVYEYSIPLLDSKNLDLSTGTVFDVQVTNPTNIALVNSPDTSTATIFLTQAAAVESQFALDGTVQLASTFFLNPTGTNYSYFGIAFKPDGTKMYVTTANSLMFQYSLSTAWDITSATYDSASASIVASAANIRFKPDGTRCYINRYSGTDSVHQYDLSTAWDISTLVDNGVSFSVYSQDTQPWGIDFSPDGTTMVIAGSSTDDVYQYTLSTAWDISTASYTSKKLLITGFTQLSGVMFNADGTGLFVTDYSSETIRKYDLSTAYDVSTGIDSGYEVLYIPATEAYGTPIGVFLKPDGSTLFTTSSEDTVLELNTRKLNTVTYDSSFNFTSTPSAPDFFTTDIISAETSDAGSSFTASKILGGLK